jgi:hypothetical protein
MKQKYFGMIREILESDSYLRRLKYFHVHYQNVKCEERYRDAFLEAFNRKHRTLDAQGHAQGFVAYAEVEKVDLVIYDLASGEHFNVEFKYQYTYDMAHKVEGEMRKWGFDKILEHARMTPKERPPQYDAKRIVRDCDYQKNCDAFILIVQDRAGHPVERSKLPGGVEANFIDEEHKLVGKPGKDWLKSTNTLLGHICAKIGGKQLPTIEREVGSGCAPLKSHFFMLDMTHRLPLNAA